MIIVKLFNSFQYIQTIFFQFIMAIRHDVVKGCAEEDINASISTKTKKNIGPLTVNQIKIKKQFRIFLNYYIV